MSRIPGPLSCCFHNLLEALRNTEEIEHVIACTWSRSYAVISASRTIYRNTNIYRPRNINRDTLIKMTTKHEEANIAPLGNAGVPEGSSSEKQVEAAPAINTSEKGNDFGPPDTKVDDAADAVGDLTLTEKEKGTLANKEEELAIASTSPPPADAAIASDTVQPTTSPFWPETAPDHPLTKFYTSFEKLIEEAQYDEVYGIKLSTSSPFHTKLILQKFLRANQNDLEKARQQLLGTLKWRKEFDPAKAANETYSKEKFDGLGYVLEVEGVPDSKNKKDIVTFNIYGAVKDKKATFGDLEK